MTNSWHVLPGLSPNLVIMENNNQHDYDLQRFIIFVSSKKQTFFVFTTYEDLCSVFSPCPLIMGLVEDLSWLRQSGRLLICTRGANFVFGDSK